MVPWWVLWNTALALAPLALAIALFRPGRHRSPAWWAGAAGFVALLPNAPYVLTDVVHLNESVRASDDDLHVAFVLLPGYLAFFAVGFLSYVLCVVRVERWLRAEGWSLPRLLGADVTLHALCAVGIFLGRVFRLNSWDVLARPHEVVGVLQVPEGRSVALVALTFTVLSIGTVAFRYAAGIRVRRAVEH
jgi:uncharacterized membrane protein